MAIFPLTPDQTISHMWSNGVRGESHGWMDLGFNSILSMQVASKDNGVYKGDYAFRMNVMEEILEIRSCIEIMANDIKVDATDQ